MLHLIKQIFQTILFFGIFLFGASAAGRPRRPASDSIRVGGVVAKPIVMYRWEVRPEAGGGCVLFGAVSVSMKLGIGYFQRMETQAKTVLIRSCLNFSKKFSLNSVWHV